MLLKGLTGIISETAIGIETVHIEVTQKNSRNLSNKSKALLLFICFGIMLILTSGQELASAVIASSVGVSGHKDLILITIVTLWYFLLSFHILCVFGIAIEVMFSCLKKKKSRKKK